MRYDSLLGAGTIPWPALRLATSTLVASSTRPALPAATLIGARRQLHVLSGLDE